MSIEVACLWGRRCSLALVGLLAVFQLPATAGIQVEDEGSSTRPAVSRTLQPADLKGLEWRSIGPANMSGQGEGGSEAG